MKRTRVAILISGRGSNMVALVAAASAPDYPAEIVLVAADRANAAGLSFAADADIPTAVIAFKSFQERRDFEAAIDQLLISNDIELVCLAGFMRLLSADFVEKWRNKLINIHPSLLPAFPGLDTHERALVAGVKVHGCTVHFVRATTDDGPIVAQAAVAVLPQDTPESLAARVLAVEHQIYPLALRLVASGAAQVVGETVLLTGQSAAILSPPLISPMIE